MLAGEQGELNYSWYVTMRWRNIRRLGRVLLRPAAIRASVAWPVFSISSFEMVYKLLERNVVPNSIIDVGANVGQFTVAAAKLFPNVQIHAFEPLKECTMRLQQNVKRLKHVTVYSLALGERDGHSSMHVNSYSLSSSILSLAPAHLRAFPYATEVSTVQVPVSTIDKIFESVCLTGPVLLKLDVQGYEANVLKGGKALLKRIDYVVMEASLKPMYEGELLFDALVDLMQSFGFRFECPVGSLEDPSSGETIQVDALFSRLPG
jgi:FkbM family methyltransferase